MKINLNHVALLVSNIENFLENNSIPVGQQGKIDEFPSEGTRELYIGKKSQLGRLLLMEAIGDGPYKDALNKRGPGLHHIAIDVPKVDDYVGDLAGSGWYLHPRSLWFYDDNRQVFLARPGVNVLIEVLERSKPAGKDHFISQVNFPFPNNKLLESLNCSSIHMGDQFQIEINGEFISPLFC